MCYVFWCWVCVGIFVTRLDVGQRGWAPGLCLGSKYNEPHNAGDPCQRFTFLPAHLPQSRACDCSSLFFLPTLCIGNSALLERTSSAINIVRGLFSMFDTSQDGYVDCSEFKVSTAIVWSWAAQQRNKHCVRLVLHVWHKPGRLCWLFWVQGEYSDCVELSSKN